jgi:hypothetical protein
MPGTRKLFISHAHELANRLVHTLAPSGMIARFVHAYAERHNRRKLTGDPVRLRELEATIGREALLAIAVEIRRVVPRAFSSGGLAPRAEESALAETFFGEFVAAVGRALEWPAADTASEARAFARDLEMYWGWRTRSGASSRKRAIRSQQGSRQGSGRGPWPGESPFPDRCAILLDPPMMEQARRAAAEFEGEFVAVGMQMFAQLGRRNESFTPRSPARATRPAPPRRKSAGRDAAAPARRSKKTGGRDEAVSVRRRTKTGGRAAAAPVRRRKKTGGRFAASGARRGQETGGKKRVRRTGKIGRQKPVPQKAARGPRRRAN